MGELIKCKWCGVECGDYDIFNRHFQKQHELDVPLNKVRFYGSEEFEMVFQ